MTILLTGSRGFLAGPLAAELSGRRPGARLALLDRLPSRGHLACDLLDAAATARLLARLKPRLLFHLAGSSRPLDFSELWKAHVQATVNLLEGCLRLPPAVRPSVVISGSAAEYGLPTNGRAAEDEPGRPVSIYGASKLCQTLAALAYRHRGLRVTVGRVFNVLGPGTPEHLAPGAFAAQIARIERGLQPPVLAVGDLRPRRDYIDVRDAASGLAALAAARPGVYNVCSGRGRPVRELLDGLLALAARRIEVRRDPERLRAGEVQDIAGSPRRLAAATGWGPRVPFSKSLQDTLEWHRRHEG